MLPLMPLSLNTGMREQHGQVYWRPRNTRWLNILLVQCIAFQSYRTYIRTVPV